MALITGIIADGHNPYTRAFQPQAADVYPPLYNLLVAPLTAFFGNTFALHRSVSAFFIVLASLTLGWAGWRDHRSIVLALATGIMFYAALLFYATPVSSTNALGVFLFLLSVLIPWSRRFSNGSLAAGALCGLLAFYTKQYFILGMAMLCLYLFLYVSMRRALLLGIAYACCLLGSLAVVHSTSPYYLDNTLFAPAAALTGLNNWQTLLLQGKHYLWIYAGLIIVLLASAAEQLRGLGSKGLGRGIRAHFSPLRAGPRGALLSGPCDFFSFCLLWTSLVIVFYLGRNPGNYLTYLFQLISPFLLLLAFRATLRLRGTMLVAAFLSLTSMYQAWHVLEKDFSTDLEQWQAVKSRIAQSDQILATQMLVMALLEAGKTVQQNGHTFYFPLATIKPDFLRKKNASDRVEAIWEEYLTSLYRKIQRREFDLVLVSSWEMRGIFKVNPPPFTKVGGREFLARHYYKSGAIELSMTPRRGGGNYRIQVWEPKPRRARRGQIESD